MRRLDSDLITCLRIFSERENVPRVMFARLVLVKYKHGLVSAWRCAARADKPFIRPSRWMRGWMRCRDGMGCLETLFAISRRHLPLAATLKRWPSAARLYADVAQRVLKFSCPAAKVASVHRLQIRQTMVTRIDFWAGSKVHRRHTLRSLADTVVTAVTVQ